MYSKIVYSNLWKLIRGGLLDCWAVKMFP